MSSRQRKLILVNTESSEQARGIKQRLDLESLYRIFFNGIDMIW